MENINIQSVRELCQRGALRAFAKDGGVYLEDTATGESVRLENKPIKSAAAPQREPERRSRTERMFGSRDTWDTPAQPRNPDADQGPYRGFLMIRCEECGEVKAYCARRETYGYKCKCGHETPLEKLRPMFMHCKCGKTFRYKTNLTAKQHTHICMDCGSPVDMEINSRGTAYVTIGERR